MICKLIKKLIKMAKQVISIGTAYDDPSADKGRVAMDKCNDNFTELYENVDELLEKSIIIEIGTWDMDTDATINIDLLDYRPADNYLPVIKEVNIIKDSILPNHPAYPLNYVDIENSGTAVNGSWKLTNAYTITLYRVGSGFFDSTDFNGSINRGYIALSYVPITGS